ncbi:heme exporter protein CcmD [Paragemmobacter straminiformis]|uniref:Heme exporter protein D n=1 Tax=Paragemmobacter straminiformis TaxID=2045119 RepID=A0A842I945_9RHOB|nr:heme exporter protein CcmD [Gemmobacter straminiformis]MBC2835887.1 heme exporter protein CcmD [Gemmobacter straminiformis]
MMPDLGKYAFAVLASYGVSVLLVLGIVVLSVWQGARVRRALAEVEARQGKTDG